MVALLSTPSFPTDSNPALSLRKLIKLLGFHHFSLLITHAPWMDGKNHQATPNIFRPASVSLPKRDDVSIENCPWR